MVNITGGADLSLTQVNELMTAVTEEFGREAHVIMGAVIDESLHGKVEVCVLGATDRFLATLAEFSTQAGGAK